MSLQIKLKKIIKIFLVLLVIILINPLSYNRLLSTPINQEYCGDHSVSFIKDETGLPKQINIVILKSSRWYKKIIRSIYSNSGRIPKSQKTYQKAFIEVEFEGGIKCKFEGEVRIHGGGKDHINSKNLYSSLRLRIDNGHIKHINNFALIINEARNFDEEIFFSTVIKEMGFLTPLYFKTKVKINSRDNFQALFVEMPSMEMAKDQNRNNGLFLSANKNNFENMHSSKYINKRSLILSRLKDYSAITDKNYKVLLNAIDKLNYIYLNSIGIGNGEINKNDRLSKLYNSESIFLNFENKVTKQELEQISIFNIMHNVMNAEHGLALEDRMFFYNPTFDQIEPVINDSNPLLGLYKEKTEVYLFDYEKKYIPEAKKRFNEIDFVKLKNELVYKGFDIDKFEILKIKERINYNFKKLILFDFLNTYEPKYAGNYFAKNKNIELDFKLGFNGDDGTLIVCSINLTKCETIKTTKKNVINILDEKFSLLPNLKNKILYIRNNKNDYIENNKPEKKGLFNYHFKEINKNFEIFLKGNIENLVINYKDKLIKYNQENESDRLVIIAKDIVEWNINLIGNNIDNKINYKRNNEMIGGCVTLLNSTFENISVKIIDSNCPNALEVLNSTGTFNKIEIDNSALDAFDAEFSKLKVDNIYIFKTKGECIGVKRGKYSFSNINATYCGDKSISTGEHAFTNIDKAILSNSPYGIVSKDTSVTSVLKLETENINICIYAYRGKYNYLGSEIKYYKSKTKCNNSLILNDENSRIIDLDEYEKN